MADFGFVGPSYPATSVYQDSNECINFLPEVDPLKQPGDRGVVALYPTPGLTIKAILPNQQEVRGLRTLSGGTKMLAVCGAYVYVFNNLLTPTMIGELNTSTGRVTISDNGINAYAAQAKATIKRNNMSPLQVARYPDALMNSRSKDAGWILTGGFV